MSIPRRETVAVIGLGGMGIVGVKNLLEEGFDVTGFERSSYVGGLWHFTEDEETLSILPTTQSNVSTERLCYTDFPFPSDVPSFCSAKQIEEYLERYVDHFGLRPHFRLNTAVKQVCREDSSGRWRLELQGMPPEWFDKVLVATGPHVRPMMPQFDGSELFAGRILHSRGFKTPEAFDGMNVVVVGLGNTGSDISDALIGHASSISVSHNHGAFVFPRLVKGLPFTHRASHRRAIIQGFLTRWLPSVAERLINKVATKLMGEAFGQPNPDWRLQPAPPVTAVNPIISDTLISNLRSEAVRSVAGIKRFLGPRELELNDGRRIRADAVICCTGYRNDLGLIEPRFNPSAKTSAIWEKSPGSRGRQLPRLYQNVFSLDHPESLAFLGCVWFAVGAFFLADISSMCVAQVWSGQSSLPSPAKMARWVDRQEVRISRLSQHGAVIPATVPQREWLLWADKTAGMGVEEHTGWGWRGWWFWWTNRELWHLVMDGVSAAAIWRLFVGKRKAWDGARGEIERINRTARLIRMEQRAMDGQKPK